MQPFDEPEARAQRRRQQSEPCRGADQGEALELHGQRLRVRAVSDAHIHAELLHGRIEELLQGWPEAVHFIDKEDVARLERGEHADEISGALEHGAGCGADAHAQLFCHEQRQRGLAESRRAEEERVIEGLFALLRRVDGDLERFFDLGLADEFIEPRRPECGVGEQLVLERFGRGDFGSGERHYFFFARAIQRTGRLSASISCGV